MPDDINLDPCGVMGKIDKPIANYEDAKLSRDALLTALHQAGTAAGEIAQRLGKMERQRDAYVRQAGGMQERIDRLRAEQEAATRHVRTLTASL